MFLLDGFLSDCFSPIKKESPLLQFPCFLPPLFYHFAVDDPNWDGSCVFDPVRFTRLRADWTWQLLLTFISKETSVGGASDRSTHVSRHSGPACVASISQWERPQECWDFKYYVASNFFAGNRHCFFLRTRSFIFMKKLRVLLKKPRT